MEKQFLNRSEAAEYLSSRGLPLSKNTLQKLASEGGGPRYQIFGRYALYQVAELNAWAEAKLGPLRSTSSCRS